MKKVKTYTIEIEHPLDASDHEIADKISYAIEDAISIAIKEKCNYLYYRIVDHTRKTQTDYYMIKLKEFKKNWKKYTQAKAREDELNKIKNN